MNRTTDPMTIAIRDGIGARLLELGFARKSSRVYVKETGTYSEWVHFRRHSEGDVADTYGIFDNALQAYCDLVLHQPIPTRRGHDPHDYHLRYQSRDHARSVINDAVEAWRRARRPWRPQEYLIEYPESAHPYLRFISERGRWRHGGDAAACAKAMLESWAAFVEPSRSLLIADTKAVAKRLVENEAGYPVFRVAALVYIGDIVGARALVDHFLYLASLVPDDLTLKHELGKLEKMHDCVESIREEYIQENKEHESMLLKVKKNLNL